MFWFRLMETLFFLGETLTSKAELPFDSTSHGFIEDFLYMFGDYKVLLLGDPYVKRVARCIVLQSSRLLGLVGA